MNKMNIQKKTTLKNSSPNFDKWTIIIDYKLKDWTEWNTIIHDNINANQFRLQERIADILWKNVDDVSFVKIKNIYPHTS